MSSGASWDDPSEDLLYELLGDVERGDEQFVIVELTADLTGQTYAQAIKADAGEWLLERRDGSADRHFRALLPDLRGTHRALTMWALATSGWQQAAPWERTSV